MSNNQNYNGWILCPSKRFPGKFYYFNVLNGEAAWSLADGEKNIMDSQDTLAYKSHCYPEPKSPPNIEYNTGNMCFQHRKPDYTDHGRKPTSNMYSPVEPVFGRVMFPTYVSNVNQSKPTVIWEQNKIDPIYQTKICFVDKSTQTYQSRRDISVQTTERLCYCLNKSGNVFFMSPPSVTQNRQLFSQNLTNFSSFQENKDRNIVGQKLKSNEPIFMDLTKNHSTSFQTLSKKIDNNPFKPKLITLIQGSETNNVADKLFIGKSKPTQSFNPKVSVPINIFQTSEETLSIGADKTEKNANIKTSLDKADLRVLLNAKKRKNTADGNLSGPTGGKKIKTTYGVIKKTTPKKRISFKDVDFDDGVISDEANNDEVGPNNLSVTRDGLNQPGINIMQKLRLSAKAMMRNDIWYIAVDTVVLLEDFEFINDFVKRDEKCRLLITRAVRSDIEAISSGDSSGRQTVFIARQIARKLISSPRRYVLQPPLEDNDSSGDVPIDNILSCCLRVIGERFHVVIVSNDSKLLAKANSFNIPCYKLQDIKDAIFTKEVTFNANNIPRTEANIKVNITNDYQPYSENYSEIPINVYKNVLFASKTDVCTTARYGSDSTISNIGRDIEQLVIKETKSRYLEKASANKTSQEIAPDNIPFYTRKADTALYNKPLPATAKSIRKVSFTSQNNKDNNNFDCYETVKNHDSIEGRPLLGLQNDMPDSNRLINHGFSEKVVFNEVPMGDNLDRFFIKSNITEDKVRSFLTEWLCSFRQIMENTLSDVLQKISPYHSTPLTLLETIDHIAKVYKGYPILVRITEKLTNVIGPYIHENGSFNMNVDPNDFLCMFAYGLRLIKNLKIVLPRCIELEEGEELLMTVLQKIENSTSKPELTYQKNVTNKSEMEKFKLSFVKGPSLAMENLGKRYPQYETREETTADDNCPYIEKHLKSKPNEVTKVFRTCGKNSNLLEIGNGKSMTIVNAKLNSEEDSNMNVVNNDDTILERNKNHDDKFVPSVKTKNTEQKVVRVIKDIRPFREKLLNEQKDCKLTSTANNAIPNGKITKELSNVKGIHYSGSCGNSVSNNPRKDERSALLNDNFDSDNRDVKKPGKNDKGKSVQPNIAEARTTGLIKEGVVDDNASDSGIDIDGGRAYTLGKSFLSELATSFHTIYQFINGSLNEIFDDKIVEERRLYLHEVVDRMLEHLKCVIDKLKRITDRESNDSTALKAVILKAGFAASTDKRMTNYRQVVKKCTEQALYLQKALKLTLAVTDTNFERLSAVDSESIGSSIQYLNIFE